DGQSVDAAAVQPHRAADRGVGPLHGEPFTAARPAHRLSVGQVGADGLARRATLRSLTRACPAFPPLPAGEPRTRAWTRFAPLVGPYRRWSVTAGSSPSCLASRSSRWPPVCS